MEDVEWLRSRIDVSTEQLWSAQQTSRALREFRQDIAGQWDASEDSAAKQLRDRFLEPHEDDDARLLARIGDQIASLNETLGELADLHAMAQRADALSGQIDLHLEESEQEQARAYAGLDEHADAAARCRALIAEAESLTAQAYST
jgi:hypothetical protein